RPSPGRIPKLESWRSAGGQRAASGSAAELGVRIELVNSIADRKNRSHSRSNESGSEMGGVRGSLGLQRYEHIEPAVEDEPEQVETVRIRIGHLIREHIWV